MQRQEQVKKPIKQNKTRRAWSATALISVLTTLTMASLAAQAVTVNVTDERGEPVNGAVVWFEGAHLLKDTQTIQNDYKMGQRDRAFTPHILVVPKGAQVSFPNYDSILHHVYSFSAAQPFEFKLYRDKPQALKFANTGVVELGCNIHDWMLGYILVVDSTHFAITDKNGVAALDLEQSRVLGTTIHVWHEGFANLDQPESMKVTQLDEKATLTYQLNQSLFKTKEDFSDEFDDYE
ncbi:methylamine utilization protein [Pseudoalteromonas sp. SMS1]|uniref:methylamine utilization protein n=1 Tax=Pseudoalteromonas sp. SMS1 TaxID=2908894 RepID=UPI001F2CC74C|nr:methylamine utilization protein [Pseudoalteromonas sp. SMS1]MCF2859265.1 methylamine utilization protein [Pseudoalteromonas sp. SMS1]